jgi:hypothetical protein
LGAANVAREMKLELNLNGWIGMSDRLVMFAFPIRKPRGGKWDDRGHWRANVVSKKVIKIREECAREFDRAGQERLWGWWPGKIF